MNVVNFVLMEEVDEVIPKANKIPRSNDLGSYDEEIILEGSKAETSRISQSLMRQDELQVLCTPL